MEKKYILSLDQGTSSSRALLFDREMKVVGLEQTEFSQYYPKPGWVEHNPMEIWDSQVSTVKNLLINTKINVEEIAAIGITNQRETAILWDKLTGEPVYKAIVWQDKRTADFCNMLKKEGWDQ